MGFNWFRNALTDDEPLENQAGDVEPLVRTGNWTLFEGCDEIRGATGRFGIDASNPIPVNGPIGETVYLSRLRSKSGVGCLYHRIGTVRTPALEAVIDRFELVAIDASQWAILNLCPYFPRRSRKPPDGFSLAPWRDANEVQKFMLKVDALGSKQFIKDFPQGLPAHVRANESLNRIVPNLAATTSMRVQEFIAGNVGKWTRPYALTEELTGVQPPSFVSPPKNDPNFIEPRHPDVSASTPKRLFTLGDFTVALLEYPRPLRKSGERKEPIIAALVAAAKNKGVLIYTAQLCYRDRPPTICVWQFDGRYRISMDEFSEKWFDLETFTNYALRALRSELGLDHLPVGEHAEKHAAHVSRETESTTPSLAPPPQNLEGFVKWLLRYSPDFEELRALYSNVDTFVDLNWRSVRDDIEENNLTSARALIARGDVIGKSYERNFKPHVDANGGLVGLPPPFQAGAVLVLVKISVFLYLAKYRYGAPIPEEQLGMTAVPFR